VKTIVSLVAASSVLVAVARFANVPKAAQAVAVPKEYRETIRKGLDYLASKQCADGHWEEDGGARPVAMTGLVGLALLMERENPDQKGPFRGIMRPKTERVVDKHWPNVCKAADWLMNQSAPGREGLLFSDHASETTRYMQGHGLATIFLAGVCEHEIDAARSRKLTGVLARAVKYIASAQSTQGGWHDTSRVEGHDFATIPATVIQAQALQAAEHVGIALPSGVANDYQVYLKRALDKGLGLSDTAAAFACLARPGIGKGENLDGSKYKSLRKWFDECRKRMPVGKELTFGHDELAHYYFAQAEQHLGGDSWNAYRSKMFDRLRDAQNKDGSWPAGEGTCSGPVYATAVWCTILQLDNESHPSRQRVFVDID
jgi:hypothetical protein